MKKQITDEQLRRLSRRARKRLLNKLAESTQAPPNGELDDLNAKIRVFEVTYGIDSDTLLRELEEGKRTEDDWDVCRWLMLLKLRTDIESLAARAC